jgi:hypothetical protein
MTHTRLAAPYQPAAAADQLNLLQTLSKRSEQDGVRCDAAKALPRRPARDSAVKLASKIPNYCFLLPDVHSFALFHRTSMTRLTTDAWHDRTVLATVLCADLRCLARRRARTAAQRSTAGNMYGFDGGSPPTHMRAACRALTHYLLIEHGFAAR